MNTIKHWIYCPSCDGLGKILKDISLKKQIRKKVALAHKEQIGDSFILSLQSKKTIQRCTICLGSGLQISQHRPIVNDKNYPHVAIVGAGIGGVALAVALLHREIPFTLFERDQSFNDRSQGYGLTLQQASKEMKRFGITNLDKGLVSTLHYAFSSEGEVVGKWGLRNLDDKEAIEAKNNNKPTNIHIARQSLRLALINQLGGQDHVAWNHQLVDLKTKDQLEMTFLVDGVEKQFNADILVGADGIRSSVRRMIIGEEKTPLRYLGCIVILGICNLDVLKDVNTELLDGKTVFQMANGNERMYMMPFDEESLMWQFSFPVSELDAKELSRKGAKELKAEVVKKTNWHTPIPQIIEATDVKQITGYPVYDRDLLTTDLLENAGPITIIGDAAHPMSPFKGQGANQALIDALHLAQKISTVYKNSKVVNIRKDILELFEKEMIERSSVKVKKSAEAAKFLHTDIVFQEGDVTFGSKWKSSL